MQVQSVSLHFNKENKMSNLSLYWSIRGLHPQISKGWRTTLTRTRAAGTAAAQTGISLQFDTMRAVRRDTAQSPTGRPREESPGKDHTPLSAMAKTTETETTTDQTAGTGTDRTGEEWGLPECWFQSTFSTPLRQPTKFNSQRALNWKDEAGIILYCSYCQKIHNK